jgi:hypothetical protein
MPSRNFDSLLDNLKKFNSDIDALREKERQARLDRIDRIEKAFDEDKIKTIEEKMKKLSEVPDFGEINLGPFDDFFFYLILDNVKTLF